MATPVIMPKFGMAQEEATIVRWFKREGESVTAGEPLLEVTTDKVNMEVEAPASGILRGVQYAENATVPVTRVIAHIVRADETWTAPSSAEEAIASQPATTELPARGRGRVSPLAQRLAAEHGVDLTEVVGTGPDGQITREDVERHLAAQKASLRTGGEPPSPGKVRATPAARRLAREQGIELRALIGTGPRGRVQAVDVRQAAARMPGQRTGKVVPLQGMRAIIAQRMQRSYQSAPHIHLTLSADVTALETARAQLSARADGEKISLTAFIVKACAKALRRHPLVNSTLDEEGIHIWDEVNVGVAVALPEGLIVPVLHRADQMSLVEVAQRLQDLAERARRGALRPHEVEGGTFTITNLGMYGIESFDPILNPPQVAILAVGAAIPTPMAWQGGIAVHLRMQLTLAADHRVLDGATAAQFLADVRNELEKPDRLFPTSPPPPGE